MYNSHHPNSLNLFRRLVASKSTTEQLERSTAGITNGREKSAGCRVNELRENLDGRQVYGSLCGLANRQGPERLPALGECVLNVSCICQLRGVDVSDRDGLQNNPLFSVPGFFQRTSFVY